MTRISRRVRQVIAPAPRPTPAATARGLLAIALALALAGCAGAAAAPTPAPTPVPAPVSAPTPRTPPPPLPAVPLVEGPLAPKVVYPPAGHLIESRDSNFIFGSLGNGHATLTIDGLPARVYPNGAFMAWVPNPPAAAPRYDIVAALGADTVRLSHPVRILPPRPVYADAGPLVVDTAGASPRAGAVLVLRDSEPVRVSVRAPANASVSVVWPGGRRSLVHVGSDTTAWSADVRARDLRGGASIVVARGADSVRVALARPEPIDEATPRFVRLGDIPARPDTDRTIIGRPTPGGTYKWFFLPGTMAPMTGRIGGFARVRLDGQLEAWVADEDVKPLPPDTPAPRRQAGSARVRVAADWEDVVIPIAGGERPPYLVAEDERSLRLTLYATRANTDIINYAAGDSLVRTVEWEQTADDRAQYTVRLRRPLFGWLVLWEGSSLVLRVRRPPPVDPAHPLRGLTIAVDPGHPPIGATGPTGLWEPQATLPVGEHLRRLLEARGATVVMTRTTMAPVELGLRPIIARRAGAHAFVSIHLNAYPDGVDPFRARNGSGTYFFRAHSEPLARAVQRGLVANMGLPDLGVNYDNLAVVRPSWMPMVLCEGAFVIVPEQEAAMRTPEFQERYARGIVEGLEEYFRTTWGER